MSGMYNGLLSTLSAQPSGRLREYAVPVNGITIEVIESSGQGKPLFLCHGNSSAANSFTPLLEGELGRRHRLVALSFPGHGASGRASNPNHSYSIGSFGTMVANIVETYGQKRYWLLGHSLGGHVLLESLIHLPGAMGLFLVSAPPISMNTMDAAFRADPSAGCLFKGELDDAEVDLLAACFTSPDHVRLLNTLKSNIRRTDIHFRPALGASLSAGKLGDERAALACAKIPVASVAGTDDKFLQIDYHATIPAEQLWRGTTSLFEGHGHALHLEAPDRFSALVNEFLSETSD